MAHLMRYRKVYQSGKVIEGNINNIRGFWLLMGSWVTGADVDVVYKRRTGQLPNQGVFSASTTKHENSGRHDKMKKSSIQIG